MNSTFADLGVPHDLVDSLTGRGITTAFPIQEATLRDALAGRDICGRAPTGSGKTLAFGIPVAALVTSAKPGRPTALILTPTRELANQIRDVILPLAQPRHRSVAVFVGGRNIKTDLSRLRKGVDIAVATPGRLVDLIDRGACDLRDVELVVLDEADRMADMGFLPVVKQLLDQTNEDRQTLLFSATLDNDVDVLIRRYQHDPARHELEADEDTGDVRHLFWPTDRPDRRQLTAEIVKRVSPAIVFTRTKHGADRLAKQLAKSGISTAAIHGNRSQGQRERALRDFSNGTVAALVATDVAARGIHVDDVEGIVHFDIAGTSKDYLHRSGRTGRAGANGVVVTLVTDADHKAVADIQRDLDLERGHHDPDLDDLTSAEPPAAVPTRRQHAGNGRPASRDGQRSGNRNRGRSRGGSKNGSRNRARTGNGSGRSSGNGSGNGARSGKGAARSASGDNASRTRARAGRQSAQGSRGKRSGGNSGGRPSGGSRSSRSASRSKSGRR